MTNSNIPTINEITDNDTSALPLYSLHAGNASAAEDATGSADSSVETNGSSCRRMNAAISARNDITSPPPQLGSSDPVPTPGPTQGENPPYPDTGKSGLDISDADWITDPLGTLTKVLTYINAHGKSTEALSQLFEGMKVLSNNSLMTPEVENALDTSGAMNLAKDALEHNFEFWFMQGPTGAEGMAKGEQYLNQILGILNNTKSNKYIDGLKSEVNYLLDPKTLNIFQNGTGKPGDADYIPGHVDPKTGHIQWFFPSYYTTCDKDGKNPVTHTTYNIYDWTDAQDPTSTTYTNDEKTWIKSMCTDLILNQGTDNTPSPTSPTGYPNQDLDILSQAMQSIQRSALLSLIDGVIKKFHGDAGWVLLAFACGMGGSSGMEGFTLNDISGLTDTDNQQTKMSDLSKQIITIEQGLANITPDGIEKLKLFVHVLSDEIQSSTALAPLSSAVQSMNSTFDSQQITYNYPPGDPTAKPPVPAGPSYTKTLSELLNGGVDDKEVAEAFKQGFFPPVPDPTSKPDGSSSATGPASTLFQAFIGAFNGITTAVTSISGSTNTKLSMLQTKVQQVDKLAAAVVDPNNGLNSIIKNAISKMNS